MLVRTVGLRISLLSVLCLYGGSALAVDAASPPSSASFGTPPDPKAFVTLASQDNMTEVQLGELSQFARQTVPMLEEHERMADKLNPNKK
jgi:hypothetical protein